MNRIKQHLPASVDGIEICNNIEFNTTEELLKIEFVKRYSEMNNFDYFGLHENILVAVFDGGKKWICIGSIENLEIIDLPRIGWRKASSKYQSNQKRNYLKIYRKDPNV